MTTEVIPQTYGRVHRLGPYLATDATTAGHTEAFAALSPESEDFPERKASLGCLTLRFPATASQKDFWYLLTHARNALVHQAAFEATQEQLDYPTDPAATETLSLDVWPVFPRCAESFSPRQSDAGLPRGTIRLSYPREVIFSEELEFEIQTLPRWRPFVTIDRRTVEASDG